MSSSPLVLLWWEHLALRVLAGDRSVTWTEPRPRQNGWNCRLCHEVVRAPKDGSLASLTTHGRRHLEESFGQKYDAACCVYALTGSGFSAAECMVPMPEPGGWSSG